jgi:acetone carboxylase gamma subunit
MSEMMERRAGWSDNAAVLSAIHQLETRVSVLETRAGAQDDRLLTIENDLKDTKTGVQRVLQCLQDHTVVEEKDRVKLLAWIVATLLSVIGFGVTAVWQYLIR